MAGVIVNFTVGDSGTVVALTAATEKKVLEARPANNHGFKVLSWSLSFDGTTAGNSPVEAALCRGTGVTAYSTSGSGVTGTKGDPSRPETIQTTGRTGDGANTTETRGVLHSEHIHPQAGGYTYNYTMGQEDQCPGRNPGDCVYIVAKAAQTVNCKAFLRIEE